MTKAISIFRIFDYDKAIEYYINWLGFKIDWEDKPENTPIYMQISLSDIILHLSEHYGDSTPGSGVYISNFTGLKEYHKQLIDKDYKYNRPGIQKPLLKPKPVCMDVIDPFGNKLSFNED